MLYSIVLSTVARVDGLGLQDTAEAMYIIMARRLCCDKMQLCFSIDDENDSEKIRVEPTTTIAEMLKCKEQQITGRVIALSVHWRGPTAAQTAKDIRGGTERRQATCDILQKRVGPDVAKLVANFVPYHTLPFYCVDMRMTLRAMKSGEDRIIEKRSG
jgi:hypothetical protein